VGTRGQREKWEKGSSLLLSVPIEGQRSLPGESPVMVKARGKIEGHFPYSNEFSRVAPHLTKKVISDRVSLVPLIGTKFQIREGVDLSKILYK